MTLITISPQHESTARKHYNAHSNQREISLVTTATNLIDMQILHIASSSMRAANKSKDIAQEDLRASQQLQNTNKRLHINVR